MNLLQKFKNIDQNHKSLIFLNWIYTIGSIISGVFTTFYVYKLFGNSIEILLYFLIFYFIIVFIGFSGIGAIFAIYKKDIKNLYYLSYLLFFLSFISIFLSNFSIYFIFFYYLFYGLGNGAFRCAVHTQELAHIEDAGRDKYSSIISSGDNLIKFRVPLFISALFAISLYFKFNGYIILFLIMPVLYIFSFSFVNDIKSYIPKSKISKNDIKNFFSKKYFYIHSYFFSVGFYQGVNTGGIITILFFKNEIDIGLFQGIMSILSTLIVLFLIKKRKVDKRLTIYFYASLFSVLNILLFFFNLSLIGFIVFSLIGLLIGPIYRVSEHVYDLRSMDFIKHGTSDFFPAMILREVFLIAGRILPVLFIILIMHFYNLSKESLIHIILTIIALGQLGAFLFVYMFDNKKIISKFHL
ncbi:MAG: hypothetical protein PHG82_00745 [Candidatus Gracilibacteria bacterium]|nr:hypothetical protein [Candidatus Gracilibacteria bacterium]